MEVARAQITQGALKSVHLSFQISFSLLTVESAIFNDNERALKEFPVPVCQVVQVKPMGAGGEGQAERFRLVVSDIQNFVQCMLATRE